VNPARLVSTHLADPRSSWAIGTFGAIAEFHRAEAEAAEVTADTAVTGRGGIRVRLESGVRAVAWERPAAADSWVQGLALCLDTQAGAMSGRTTVCELGPDEEALQPAQRGEVLFDLGIGAAHCNVCIRSADPEVLGALRRAAGKPLLESDAFAALAALSPTRVFISRLGRIEVSTPIPLPKGKTPDGPHTHVLPALLRLRRTHSATVPLPARLLPCAEIYPESPILDAHGARKPFEPGRFEAFQELLAAHGDPACLQAKRETFAAVRAGEPPRQPVYSRSQRLARRVALRQLAQLDGPSPTLAEWQRVFDRQGAGGACV
jgi:hypothetical protein